MKTNLASLAAQAAQAAQAAHAQSDAPALAPAQSNIGETFFRYWGKARPSDQGPQWHLLPYHCLDVAACNTATCW